MFTLYQTPVDYLYLVLTISVGLLALFIILAIYNLIRIMVNIRHVSERAKETVDLVNHYLWQPIRFITEIMERGKEYAESKAEEAPKKKKKK